MLVLVRKAGESIRVSNNIEIHVISVEGHRVRLGINAPREVRIVRAELDPSIVQANQNAAVADQQIETALLHQAAQAQKKSAVPENQKKEN